jgi:hypothetical protein
MATIRRSGIAMVLASALVAVAAPALAGSCFEDVGCPDDHAIPESELRQLSCDALWTVRNSIYHDNGYCFQTARALEVWSNQGCRYHDSARVPLNAYESGNVERIRTVEREKGCP